MLDIFVIVLLFVVLSLIVFVLFKLSLLSIGPKGDLERLERMMHTDTKDLRQELGQSLIQFNDSIRKTVEERLDKMSRENAEKLEQMRTTIDEKLHTTLEKRLGESFALVSDRLEKVHQGLGEMQNLANDVGGLKKVLTNVKMRGTWGEVQLGNLLEQILAPDQFIKNAHIQENSQEVVEYAVRLPDGNVLIPIDSKFPVEDYDRLVTASENGDLSSVENASVELERRIKQEAQRISSKYVDPPKTTDFGIMFLPTEGLYAEVMRRPGLASEIQSKYRICIAGPTTLGAFLNSLQMGFKTLAIQKRSGEVWQVLNEAKTEFEKYALWVEKVKKNIEQAHKTLDEADTRTRAVKRKLRSVENDIVSHNDLEKTSVSLIENK